MLKMTHLRRTVAAIATLAAASATAGGATAAENEWRMHMVISDTREEAKYVKEFVDEVNERSNGDLEITLYPSASLGIKDVDLIRILPPGNAVQAALIAPGYMARDVPELAYTIAFGSVPTRAKLVELYPLLHEIYGGIYARYDTVLLGFVSNQLSTVEVFCKEPINTLEELRSKKLRVSDKFSVDLWAKLGVSAQIIGQYDLYVAMSTGVVDCAQHLIGMSLDISLHEVAPYAAYITPYNVPPWGIVASKRAFDKLKPETQAMLFEVGEKIGLESAEPFLSGSHNDAISAEAIAAGVKVVEPFSEADQKAYRDAALEIWEAKMRSLGESATANYEKIHAMAH
ncbi:TRAP transporter substrate-binding protein DctP [Acuticoccus mangrovi]|uniref:TRAP transporter substrate-binding protein DctP n=1 Tax=Acuticoccus mangrovi TaxID=2796142 RepID=A0A934INI4_9HYPH|nr:TRAP transporter substrate-binding protein DctP [Acuticoccus mangrovi]MBJ3777137.1 TRAP transporter substrate-binding protein DctP [Acuticoccus mangrovi]